MFYKSVDLRSREAMVDFLRSHERYNTMNSWNRTTSYSNNMKIHSLGLPREIKSKAFELLSVDDAYDQINLIINDWNEDHNYQWQARFNGRSGGYLVLYRGGTKQSEYKSYCPRCGQRNFKLVPPENPTPEEEIRLMVQRKPFWSAKAIYENFADQIAVLGFSEEESKDIIRDEKLAIKNGKEMSLDDRCGVCKGKRRNYTKPLIQILTYPGQSVDQGEDFGDWTIEQLRERVKLVQSFDQLCDDIVAELTRLCNEYDVVEEQIYVPTTVKKLQPIGG
jgi:predicted  nucleic acid-binding Zn-ribbon protein